MPIFFDRQYLKTVVPLIKAAKDEILVAVYEWAWYDHQQAGTAQDVNRAVCSQGDRGITIKAILHHDYQTSHLSKLNRKSASRLRRHGAEIHFGSQKVIMHAKLWVFDATTAVICTHNISTRALTTNRELGVVFTDPAEVKQVHDYFYEIWNHTAGFKE